MDSAQMRDYLLGDFGTNPLERRKEVNVIEFNTKELIPWADIHSCLANMRGLTIKAGGQTYSGSAKLIEEDGNVTIEIASKKRGRKPKK